MTDEIKKDTVDYNDQTPFDGSKLQSISKISDGIRHKIYGADTREAIAQQGEALIKLMQETGGNQTAEVKAARGDFDLLGMREDAQDNAITKTMTDLVGKFDSNQAEAYLKSITAVPETFVNLAAIKAKYPSGKNGLMVAADNGHKYIWANNVWTDAGVYQSVGVADESATSSKRTMLGETGIIHSSTSYPDFDFRKRTLTIKPPIRIYHRDKYYSLNYQDTDLVIDLDDTTFKSRTPAYLDYGIITFHTPSETFRVRDAKSLHDIDEQELILGSYKAGADEQLLFMSSTCTISGSLPAVAEGRTDIANFPDLFEVGSIGIDSNGQNYPRTDSIRSKGYHLFKKGTKVKRLGGKIAIWFYDLETKEWLKGEEIGYPGPTEYVFSEDSLVRFVIHGYEGSIKETLSTVSILQYSSDALNELTELRAEETEEVNIDQPYYVNDSGKELVFKFPIKLNNSYMSDHTFVGDELWIVPVSNDEHTDWSTVMRYSVDVENKTATLLGTFDHNWGHVNSIDYNENTDTLVCGNGGGSGNTQPDEFYVFENASQLKNIAQVDVHEHAVVYQVEQDGFDWGKQLNTTWGQENGGKHNIIYVLSNYNSETGTADNSSTSSDTQVIHKVLLGQGANKMENGTFIEGKSGLEYNGTYKVLKEYTHPYKEDYANQGTTFYNGKIYEGIAHSRLSFFEKILDDSGKVKSILNRERLFDDTGAEMGLVIEGLAIKDDLLYLGEGSRMIYVYKL